MDLEARPSHHPSTTANHRSKGSLAPLLLGFAVATVALGARRAMPEARRAKPPAELRPTRQEMHAGRNAKSPIEIPARGWWAVLKRVWNQVNRDNISIIAAGCAFYALLALFPAITALVSIYGLIADPDTVGQQVEAMRGVLPGEAVDLIASQARQVASAGSVLGWSAGLAILLALWSASSGVRTLFTALDIAYEEEERRSLLRFNLTALLFTLGAIVAVIAGLGVIIGVPAALSYLPLGPLAAVGVRLATWGVLLVALVLGLAVVYRFGPSRAAARWRWLTPGSLLAAALWLLASVAFSYYVANFASYNQTYGTLGGVIILMMWLYLSAFVILLGAELNAELEIQTEEDTTTGRPRPIGSRRAYAADHTPETRRR